MDTNQFHDRLRDNTTLIYLSDRINTSGVIHDCNINNVYLFANNILSETFMRICLALVGNSKDYFIKELKVGYLVGLSKVPLGRGRRGTIHMSDNIDLIFISSHTVLGEILQDFKKELLKDYAGDDKQQIEQTLSNITDYDRGSLTIKYDGREIFYQILTGTILMAFNSKELKLVATRAFEIHNEDGKLIVS